MRAVDTNVVVRLLTRDDPKQSRAADGFVSRGAFVPLVVLVETIWVLSSVYELKRPAIARAVEMLLDHQTLTLQDADVVAAALSRFRGAPAASFSDCVVLETARKAGHLPLGTFDRALGRLDDVERI